MKDCTHRYSREIDRISTGQLHIQKDVKSPLAVARKKKEAAQRVIKLEYSQHTTPTRNQITTVFTTPAVTKTWIGKRIKEVRHMNVCSA